MITPQFNKALSSLNKAQREAVETIEGAVMVIAGPGTGKTQILTLRIAHILFKTQINPENILALTFTESGAYAMKKRLVDIIGTPGYRAEITTFHGFCNELIKNNPDDFPDFVSSDSVDEVEQIQIVEEIIENEKLTLLKPFGDPLYYVRLSLFAIGELKKEGITPEKFAYAIKKESQDFEKRTDLHHEKGPYKGKMKSQYEKQLKASHKNKELFIIYKAYQKALHKQKRYDFNDMLLEVIKAFEKNPQLLLRMQEKFQYILVDEHQDTNAAQNKIVELLCSYYPNPNLFVVGDEKQSIYRFQGASLENFLYFKKLYSEAVLINLKENYRSSQVILDASGHLIAHNLLASSFIPDKPRLIAKTPHPLERIKIIEATDYYSEYYLLADIIKKKLTAGISPREIAVLVRENKDVAPLSEVLAQHSIPYVVESNFDILQDLEIQKLILFFNAIHNFGNDRDMLRAMHVGCLEISPVDIIKLIDSARKKNTTVWELLNSGEYKNNPLLTTKQYIERFYTNLIQWKKYSHNEHFDYLFKSVLNDSGFMKTLITKKNSLQNLDKIIGFYEDIRQRIEKKPSFNLSDFMEYLELLKKHKVTVRRKVQVTYQNAVRLMTAHRSKGLEFDVVFIINAYDGHWGNPRKRGSIFILPWSYLLERLTAAAQEEVNEDERRLFYVALTRARKEVVISYSTRSIDGNDQVSSQFIGEIMDSHKEYLNIEEFEKNFLSNKQIMLSVFTKGPSEKIMSEYMAHKELFAEMFMQKGLSATGLNNYLECPWKYFFRNLLGLPDVMTKSALFGSAIHKALNYYLMNCSGKAALPTVEILLNAYDTALCQQPLTEEEITQLKEKGRKVLTGYYNERIIRWDKNLISELDIKGVYFSGKVKLTGKIDMIKPIKGDEVVVYDFKTGKPKSRSMVMGTTKSGDGNYKRQLVFYKILLDQYQFKKMEMTTGIIEFIEPNERNIYKSEEFTITDEEVKALKEQIYKVSNEIISFNFLDKGCKKADCEYCALRSHIAN